MKNNFTKGQKVTVRFGYSRKTYKWCEGTYLYKKDLYHYIKLDGNRGIVGVMTSLIKEVKREKGRRKIDV
jgi:hypothetical protein